MRSAYSSYDTFYVQARLSPLKIALIEIILPNINRLGAGKEMSSIPGWKVFQQFISAWGRLLGTQVYLVEYYDCIRLQVERKLDVISLGLKRKK